MRCSRNVKSYGRGGYCTGDPKLDNFIVGDGGRIAATDFEFAEPFSPHIAREEEAANLVPGFISSNARSIARMYREKGALAGDRGDESGEEEPGWDCVGPVHG